MNINEIERYVAVLDKLTDVQNKGRISNAYDIERAIIKLAKQVADATIDDEESLPF